MEFLEEEGRSFSCGEWDDQIIPGGIVGVGRRADTQVRPYRVFYR